MAKPETAKNFDVLSAADVADLLCVSEKTVRNWMNKNGLPFSEAGRGRVINWPDALNWYVNYRISEGGNGGNGSARNVPSDPPVVPSETYDQALTRKTIAEADLKELQLAKDRGQVVAVGDVETALAKIATSLKTAILAMPAKMVSRTFGLKDRAQLRKILDKEAAELCRKCMALGIGREYKEATEDAD